MTNSKTCAYEGLYHLDILNSGMAHRPNLGSHIFVNKVLLDYVHTHSFTYGTQLLLCTITELRVETESKKYLPYGPL
jgi:hypothetical protein